MRRPEELARVDGLVLPGGESTTLGMLLDSAGLTAPIKARIDAGMAVFGTCAGMILLAAELLDARTDQHPLGAIDVTVRRNAFGRQLESFEADLDVVGLDGGPMHAVFIRAPVVERVGPDVEVLATVEYSGRGRRPVVCHCGVVTIAAFHPELASDDRLHGRFLRDVRASL